MSRNSNEDAVGNCGCIVAWICLVLVGNIYSHWDVIIDFLSNHIIGCIIVAVVICGLIQAIVDERREKATVRKAEEAKRAEAVRKAKEEQQAKAAREAEEAAARQAEEAVRRAEEAKSEEKRFLRCLFSMLAKLAKADGRIDAEEVKMAEKVFDRFGFALRRRRFCSNTFNSAKDNSRTIYWYAEQFGNQVSDVEICIFVYELLWDVACADGWLHPAEKEMLRNICGHLHIPNTYFDINYRRRKGSFVEGDKRNARRGFQESARRQRNCRSSYVSGKSSILDAYELLESEPSATLEELKSAYRRVAKRYHPDLLRANGVPEEMIAKATELMAQINAAWDDIRKTRAFE